MIRFLVNRLGQAVVVVFLITLIVFLVVYFIPGDPVTALLGTQGSPQEVTALRHEFGLDQPLVVRYGKWLWQILHLNLGSSILLGNSVLGTIGQALPVTLELIVLAEFVALLISVPSGIAAGLHPNSRIDFWARSVSFLGQAVPNFLLGFLLIWLLGVRIPIFPTYGFVHIQDGIGLNLRSMTLPAFTLGFLISAPLTRYLRASIIRTVPEYYVMAARAKGLSTYQVAMRHVVRNSLLPFITQVGLQIGYLLGGAIVTEQVFSIPGIGQLAITSFNNRDYPVIQGVVLLVAIGFVLINLLVDVLYTILDPRIEV